MRKFQRTKLLALLLEMYEHTSRDMGEKKALEIRNMMAKWNFSRGSKDDGEKIFPNIAKTEKVRKL